MVSNDYIAELFVFFHRRSIYHQNIQDACALIQQWCSILTGRLEAPNVALTSVGRTCQMFGCDT